MSPSTNTNSLLKNIVPMARAFYAIGIIGIGIQHFIYASFLPVIMPAWPAWLQSPICAYIAGAGLVIAGALILFSKNAGTAAIILGIALLFLFIAFQAAYQLFISPNSFHWGLWTNPLKESALAGGAFLVAASFSTNQITVSSSQKTLIVLGRILFSITMIVFGYAHFLYTEFVATLVPSWIPGATFWTYFAGVALMASGVAIILGIMRRQVAILLGIMIFIWLLILHVPRAIEDINGNKGNELTSVFQALAFSGIAFIIAGVSKGFTQRR